MKNEVIKMPVHLTKAYREANKPKVLLRDRWAAKYKGRIIYVFTRRLSKDSAQDVAGEGCELIKVSVIASE